MHLHRFNHDPVRQAKVEPLARLREIAIPRVQGPRHPVLPGLQRDARPDCIPVARNSLQHDRDGRLPASQRVAKEAQARRRAVGDPEVERPVLVPVNQRDRTRIVRVIKPAQGRDIRKARLRRSLRHPAVQEHAIALAATERASLAQHGIEGIPARHVAAELALVGGIDR